MKVVIIGNHHIKVLSNMMEEETHVVDSMSDHEGICQILFEAIEDQSEVCGELLKPSLACHKVTGVG